MTKAKAKTDRLVCKFCGAELHTTSGVTMSMTIFRDPKGGGFCKNRSGADTWHHPDSPEYNGGEDYSDGRALVSA